MKHDIRTMQDLLENLDKLGYSEAVVNQIRPRIRDCEVIYNAPLRRIPADYDAFIDRWGNGRIGALAEGFKSREHFVEWRKRVRAALSRCQVRPQNDAELLPDWEAVIAHVTELSGPQKPLGPHRQIGVALLGRLASAADLGPTEITAASIETFYAGLRSEKRRTFRRGLETLNAFVAAPELAGPVRHLLRETPYSLPASFLGPAASLRRGGPAEATRLWREFDVFVAAKRGNDALGRPIAAGASAFKPRTAETYENALSLALGVLERAGDIAPGTSLALRDLCSLAAITRFVELWQLRALDGEVRSDAGTLHLAVERLSHIAVFSGFVTKADRKKLQKLRDTVRKSTPRRSKMSAPREAWIKAFARSMPQQLAVHGMPEKLMAEANCILEKWDELKRARRHKERMRALRLGIAAVQAAVLFRGSAIRAKNLRNLTFRGPNAQLFLKDRGDVWLSIPASLVKNNVAIEADFDADARAIIEWYLAEIRPRLVSEHPYGHHLSDCDFLFPSKTCDSAMEETVFAGHYRFGVEAVGLDMTLHQARHITAYFILDADPSAIALAAAVLGDEVSTVEAHYAFLDGVKAVREARLLLQEQRAKSRKHKKGVARR